MNTDSNRFTFGFSVVMVLVVAVSLSWVAMVLKPYQKENKNRAKKQSILSSIGIDSSPEEVDEIFAKYVRQLVLDEQGKEKHGEKAFEIDLATELKKKPSLQRFPLYIAQKEDGRTYYIVPLRGFGLWDAIWGYIAIEEDLQTVYGASFDHKSETPGLGAEISTPAFSKQFQGKKIKSDDGKMFLRLIKGGVASIPASQRNYGVDAVSGGTITSDGVSNMIKERLERIYSVF